MADMEDMYSNTRYVSNVSSNLGGTGLTALYTGLGMVYVLKFQTLSVFQENVCKCYQEMLVRIANRENPDQTASSEAV